MAFPGGLCCGINQRGSSRGRYQGDRVSTLKTKFPLWKSYQLEYQSHPFPICICVFAVDHSPLRGSGIHWNNCILL
jgi:hypothetical protein